MKTIDRKTAFSLSAASLRLKAKDHPELAALRGRDIKRVAIGLKQALERQGFRVDEDAAEGIADAIQEMIPASRDEDKSMLVVPWASPFHRRSRLWRPPS